jgi:hypothetical protein
MGAVASGKWVDQWNEGIGEAAPMRISPEGETAQWMGIKGSTLCRGLSHTSLLEFKKGGRYNTADGSAGRRISRLQTLPVYAWILSDFLRKEQVLSGHIKEPIRRMLKRFQSTRLPCRDASGVDLSL